MATAGRFRGARSTKYACDRITTVLVIPMSGSSLGICRPICTTGRLVPTMLVIQTVGLHQSGQTGHMGLMALGAGKGMLRIGTPAFDGFMNPVNRLPVLVLVGSISKIFLLMTVHA